MRVADVMRSGDNLPVVQSGTSVTDAFKVISAKRMGMTAVVNRDHEVMGIFTDGDLRRVLSQGMDVRSMVIDDVMTRQPRTIDAQRLASEVAHLMDTTRINHLLVVDSEGKLLGAVGIHDLLESKVL
jgi:arabinose-5-phosphate isomerase